MYDLMESFPESAAVNVVGSRESGRLVSLGGRGRARGGCLSAQYSATSNRKSRPCVARSRVSTAAFVGRAATKQNKSSAGLKVLMVLYKRKWESVG